MEKKGENRLKENKKLEPHFFPLVIRLEKTKRKYFWKQKREEKLMKQLK